uniref:Fungal lipase-type domain-containing protein n=1 Tax=Chenopodium quinoa TaxID=63459 RepID=A0A803LFE0_CHEQI
MATSSLRRFLHQLDKHMVKKHESYGMLVYGALTRFRSLSSKSDSKGSCETSKRSELIDKTDYDRTLGKYSSDDDELNDSTRKSELAWLTKALEPALQLCRWAFPGNGSESKPPPSSRSIAEIVASIQRSKTGLQDWSLSDLTIGLYLVYLRQASAAPLVDVKGVQITSESVVQDLIYHLELARGSYRDTPAGLARQSMLRESNILKFIRNSSVMRPGYYIGIDPRRKLVILGIRGTHTVYDLVTDIVSTSDGDVTFEGYSTHFGTAEAARWFLNHEMGTIKKCLHKHEGFRLRLVGHSLGASTASLLAMMLRQKSATELGFDPSTVTAVGIATPPCVSKELAESCCDYVSTVVMQVGIYEYDDVVPRLSVASLARLRNEIIQTDWMSVLKKEDYKSVMEFFTNAKQVMSSVQDVARKVADYANFRSRTNNSGILTSEDSLAGADGPPISKPTAVNRDNENAALMHEELFVPGTIYYLKRNTDAQTSSSNRSKAKEYFTLWKWHPGQHFQEILLSSNLISDHKCESHYYALRDVIKGLPGSSSGEGVF